MNIQQLAAVLSPIWCMEDAAFRAMLGNLRAFVLGNGGERKGVLYQERCAAAGSSKKKRKEVAVLSLHGPIDHRGSMWLDWIGGTGADQFGAAFDMAMDDPTVKSVLIDVNSPGGNAMGTPELAKKIYKRRGEKPIVAVADAMAASAAYWIGTAADRLYVTESGYVGSVGVFSVHEDWSQALANDGIKVTINRIPEFKAEGTPYEAATDEFIASEMSDIGRIYGEFVDAVAKHRGTSVKDVRDNYGKGRVVDAKAAVAAGMADGVATFEQVLSRMQDGRLSVTDKSASFEDSPKLNADALRVCELRLRMRDRKPLLTGSR